jgi:hypothetical protein
VVRRDDEGNPLGAGDRRYVVADGLRELACHLTEVVPQLGHAPQTILEVFAEALHGGDREAGQGS